LYYCWSNNQVNIRQSEFLDNAGSGVGDLGGGDTNNTARDINNTIEDSVMSNNGRAGIDVTGGGNAANPTIQRNTLRDNNHSNLNGGYAGIQVSSKKGDAQRYTITNNLVESTLASPTQLYGIREANPASYGSDFNTITNNTVRNHAQANIVAIGANTV